MEINTNINSLNAQAQAQNTNKNLSSSLEKLSSGLRINKAADDVAGMSIADKLRTQASSLNQSIRNANDGVALVQIADMAMSEQSNILDTIKTKLIQASNTTLNREGKEAIRKEMIKLLDNFDDIASNTNFNGINLLNDVDNKFSFQVGENAQQTVEYGSKYAANTVYIMDELYGDVEINETNILAQGDSKTNQVSLDTMDMQPSTSGVVEFTGNVTSFTANQDVKIKSTDPSDLLDLTIERFNSGDGSVGRLFSGGQYIIYAGTTIENSGVPFLVDNSLNFSSAGAGISLVDISTGAYLNQSVFGGVGVDIFKAAGAYQTSLLAELKKVEENGLTPTLARESLEVIDEALSNLNKMRSDFGSVHNQLESATRNLMVTEVNLKNAESGIRDTDYALESSNFSKNSFIAQSSTFVMSQANALQDDVVKFFT